MINDDNLCATLFQSGNSFTINSNDDQVYATLFQSGNSFTINSNDDQVYATLFQSGNSFTINSNDDQVYATLFQSTCSNSFAFLLYDGLSMLVILLILHKYKVAMLKEVCYSHKKNLIVIK